MKTGKAHPANAPQADRSREGLHAHSHRGAGGPCDHHSEPDVIPATAGYSGGGRAYL